MLSVPGSIVANTWFIKQFCTIHTAKGQCVLDSRYVGAFTGIQSVGQILGMLGGPIISDRFGRKINIICLVCLLSIGVIVEMVAKSDPVWLVARLFAGWGTGMSQTVIPTYISEIAWVSSRKGDGAVLTTAQTSHASRSACCDIQLLVWGRTVRGSYRSPSRR